MTFKRITCKRCKGAGFIMKMDPVLHYLKSYDCPKCYGTGFDSSAEAIDEGMAG